MALLTQAFLEAELSRLRALMPGLSHTLPVGDLDTIGAAAQAANKAQLEAEATAEMERRASLNAQAAHASPPGQLPEALLQPEAAHAHGQTQSPPGTPPPKPVEAWPQPRERHFITLG